MPYSQVWGPSGPNTETFTPQQLLAGPSEVINQTDTLVLGAGACVIGQVLGRITASGKLTKHTVGASDGSQIAVAILAEVADSTAADKTVQVYIAGEFNMDALTFHASTNTDALKRAVFGDLSPLVVKKLGDWGQLG
jgi:hypothetical protein